MNKYELKGQRGHDHYLKACKTVSWKRHTVVIFQCRIKPANFCCEHNVCIRFHSPHCTSVCPLGGGRIRFRQSLYSYVSEIIGPAVRADFRGLYPANIKTPTCCPSDDNRTKVTNSVTSARFLWWHVGPYFWPADLTRTANPILV